MQITWPRVLIGGQSVQVLSNPRSVGGLGFDLDNGVVACHISRTMNEQVWLRVCDVLSHDLRMSSLINFAGQCIGKVVPMNSQLMVQLIGIDTFPIDGDALFANVSETPS